MLIQQVLDMKKELDNEQLQKEQIYREIDNIEQEKEQMD